jgi:hypothetical protein
MLFPLLQLMAERVRTAPVVRSDEDEEALRMYKSGFIEPPLFDAMFAPRAASDDSEGDYEEDDDSIGADAETQTTVSWDTALDGQRMEVCSKFLKDECTSNGCPQAHPGLRDKASIFYARVVGSVRKVPFVALCVPALSGACARTRLKDCRHYHTYVRPSTENMIDRLYPVQGDKKTTFFASGAVLKGKVNRQHVYSGFGVLSYPDTSTFMGNWSDNLRHGFGLYRSAGGVEYCGQWRGGAKHGFGILKHPNGEEYSGEWEEGVMSGLGTLTSRSGDAYRGQFAKHKYEGLYCTVLYYTIIIPLYNTNATILCYTILCYTILLIHDPPQIRGVGRVHEDVWRAVHGLLPRRLGARAGRAGAAGRGEVQGLLRPQHAARQGRLPLRQRVQVRGRVVPRHPRGLRAVRAAQPGALRGHVGGGQDARRRQVLLREPRLLRRRVQGRRRRGDR